MSFEVKHHLKQVLINTIQGNDQLAEQELNQALSLKMQERLTESKDYFSKTEVLSKLKTKIEKETVLDEIEKVLTESNVSDELHDRFTIEDILKAVDKALENLDKESAEYQADSDTTFDSKSPTAWQYNLYIKELFAGKE
jgi:hypothetical protein